MTSSASAPTSSTTAALRFGAAGEDALGSSYGPTFPLTLRRTGGIAGFDDQIVLEANGRVRVETRSVHGRVCTLSAPQQRQLVTLLATLRLGSSTAPPPTDGSTALDPDAVPESDPITISVTDHQARAIDLSDPSLGEISGPRRHPRQRRHPLGARDDPLHDADHRCAGRDGHRPAPERPRGRSPRRHARGRYAAGLTRRHTDLCGACPSGQLTRPAVLGPSEVRRDVVDDEARLERRVLGVANFSVTFVPL